MSLERLQPADDDGTPRLRVQLAHVALMSVPADEMMFPVEDNVQYMDILHQSYRQHLNPEIPEGPIIGKLNVRYYPIGRLATIQNVELEPDYRGRRWGLEIYQSIPHLPLPDREDFHESGYRFLSDANDSDAGKRVWRSLTRRGLADRVGWGKYEMHYDAPPPQPMIIEEID